MHMTHDRKHRVPTYHLISFMNATKADSLTGFIAGFLVGIIGMYVYVVIVSNVA